MAGSTDETPCGEETGGEGEAYADDHPYVQLFGDTGRARILAAFIGERTRDVTISYVAQLAGVDRSTVYAHLDELQAAGVIEETRTMGGSTYYTVSDDSEIAAELYRLEGVGLKAFRDE